MIQYPHTLKNNIYLSNNWGPLPFFHSDTNPVLGQVLVHSIDKTHLLVVKVELTWLLFLNMIPFNFVHTPNKSLRFTRFRKSYVYCLAVVLIKVALLSCFMCTAQSGNFHFFCSCLFPMVVHLCNLFLLSTPVARILLTSRWISRLKDVK